MPVTNGYTTRAALKTALGISAATTFDADIDRAINAASRWIDDYTGRRFYAATETRYYSAPTRHVLPVDDLLSVTTLKTDADGDRVYEDTWATTDYDLLPYNALVQSPPGPYTQLQTTPEGSFHFPLDMPRGVEIVGSWGYVATAPPDVEMACVLWASRLFRRKDAPFGLIGGESVELLRSILQSDPDVLALLRRFVRSVHSLVT